MQRIDDVPLFDAGDYLSTPRECAEFLLHLFHDGNDDDLRRGFSAVARATGRPVEDLPADMFALMLDGDAERAAAVFARMGRLGIVADRRPVSST